jgi:hypothetical protein
MNIYVLKDNLGYFCYPSISEDNRTLLLALARQFKDLPSATVFSDVKGMQIYMLNPCPV